MAPKPKNMGKYADEAETSETTAVAVTNVVALDAPPSFLEKNDAPASEAAPLERSNLQL